MAGVGNGRILVERAIGRDGETVRGSRRRAVRSVTVNLAESPLGWLFARGMVTSRQLQAGGSMAP